MTPVRFHPEAVAEADEAAAYYEARKTGLGVDFRKAIAEAVRRIEQAPERWSPLTERTRRFRLRRFAYAVIYAILPGRISVVAVAHDKRKPGYCKDRL